MARGPMSQDLVEYSYKDLMELQERIVIAIATKQTEEREQLKARMREMAAEAGMSIEEVLGTQKAKQKRSGAGTGTAAAVKYRNPDNPEETWSGRGRMAKWLAEKIKKRGVKVEDFLV